MKRRITEAQLLQNYGVLFQNVKKDTVLAAELAEYGYDAAALTQGEDLYNALLEKYNANKTETAQETTAYAVFNKSIENAMALYTTDRKKAKIIFKDQPDVLKNLEVQGLAPVRNAALINTMKLFYNALNNNADWLNAVSKLKLNQEQVSNQLANISQTETDYAAYIQEKGESQQATQDKNKAFDDVTLWIREFYAVARIALEDQPQLLESVAKLVRS